MKLEEAIGRLNRMITVSSIMKLDNLINSDADLEYIKNAEAIEIALQEIEHLQKENEELKNMDLTTVHIKGVCDEKERWRNKIKELILNKKQKIQENNNEIEECRKTIMEEQELKKLRLYTLHKNNELLELEIADMFDLLKEE